MPEYGVLMVNLGTPEEPQKSPVGRFLVEFLSDHRVVNLPRWWWIPLLRVVIVPLRRGRVTEAYREIWLDDGSPLLVYSHGLAQGVQELLDNRARITLQQGGVLPA